MNEEFCLHLKPIIAAAGSSLIECASHSARISSHNNSGWHVLRHDAASTDDAAITDRDAGTDDRLAADPNIVADRDRLAEFLSSPLLRVQRMRGGIDVNAGSEKDVAPDPHFANVQDHAIEVEVDLLAKINIGPVVTAKGWFQPN